MKKFLISIILFICLFVGSTNTYANVKDNFKTPYIQEIIVNVPSNILFYSAEEFGINIRTIDEDLYKSIKYEIKDDKLYIDFNNYKYNDNDNLNPEDIKIYIQAPNEIKNIKTNSNLLVATIQKNNKATNHGKN